MITTYPVYINVLLDEIDVHVSKGSSEEESVLLASMKGEGVRKEGKSISPLLPGENKRGELSGPKAVSPPNIGVSSRLSPSSSRPLERSEKDAAAFAT